MSRTFETHSARNPRLLVFHGIVIGLMLILATGMAVEQLFKSGKYSERERIQNQRRVIVPGPRGRILDRDGQVLVDNRARFSAVLDLAELRSEFTAELRVVTRNYSQLPKDEQPSYDQRLRIARTTVAQRHLDRINAILRRTEKVNASDLNSHINQRLLLPYTLVDDLAPEEYARLIERLPVASPLQVYATSARSYPHHSLAAHVLGFIGKDDKPEIEDFPGEDLRTFAMDGSFGRDGLEKQFDSTLQGKTGGVIYRVDPAGYKILPALETRLPVQGKSLAISLDLDLQLAAEQSMENRDGAAVAIDIRTGEVLVMVSKPDFDPLTRRPNLPDDMPKEEREKSGVWLNRATQGQYPPGSTFKIITAIAGLRAGTIEPDSSKVVCPGFYMVGNRRFPCWNHNGHGEVNLVRAIQQSCNVFFYKYGLETTPEFIASEAKRFGFNHMTGIELPNEFRRPRVADPAWRKESWQSANLPDGIWRGGDTANTAIGQGDTLINPLQAACMVASFARGEIETKPTILHDPRRPEQHSAPIGLSPSDYNTILEGMKECYYIGTAKLAKVDDLSGAAKTGTAQKGRIELAWTVAFAPAENPRIAVAVVLEGDENMKFGGGTNAAPVVKDILQAWKDKSERPPPAAPVNLRLD